MSSPRGLCGLLLALLGFVACSQSQPAPIPTPADLTIRAALVRDGNPAIYAAGVTADHWKAYWVDFPQEGASYRATYLQGLRPGMVVLEFFWPQQDSPVIPDAAAIGVHMEATYRLVADEVLSAGGTLFVHFRGPPRWASSDPSNTNPILPGVNESAIWSRSAPLATGDYRVWRSAIQAIAQWFVDQYATSVVNGRVLFVYGVELNNEEFYGPLSAYAEAYTAFAQAVRAVDSRLRVGGGGVAGILSPKSMPANFASSEPAMQLFLRACAAQACPLDFIYWHQFTVLPVGWGHGTAANSESADAIADTLGFAAQWLAESGFSSTEVMVTDWTTLEFNDRGTGRVGNVPLLSSEEDTEYRAAFIAATLVSMQRQGFTHHAIGTLFEWSHTPGEFVGDWGLLTNAGVTKPAFAALRLAGELLGCELHPVVSADSLAPFVFADAGRKGGRTYVLLGRFVPDVGHNEQMLLHALGYRLLALGHNEATLCSEGLCTEAALGELLTTRDFDAFPLLSQPTRTVFAEWFVLEDAARAAPGIANVSIAIDGLTPGAYTVTRARVNSTQSNTYHHCVALGLGCDDVAAINDAVGTPRATESQAVEVGADGRLVLSFELERHEVGLVTLE